MRQYEKIYNTKDVRYIQDSSRYCITFHLDSEHRPESALYWVLVIQAKVHAKVHSQVQQEVGQLNVYFQVKQEARKR